MGCFAGLRGAEPGSHSIWGPFGLIVLSSSQDESRALA